VRKLVAIARLKVMTRDPPMKSRVVMRRRQWCWLHWTDWRPLHVTGGACCRLAVAAPGAERPVVSKKRQAPLLTPPPPPSPHAAQAARRFLGTWPLNQPAACATRRGRGARPHTTH
jgi:hypothetical protein